MPMNIDIEPLKRFEDGLDPEHPERSAIPAKILGYGEISTIFEIDAESTKGIACKRMAIFRTEQEVSEYENIYNSYNTLLEKEIRIGVPDYGFAWFFSAKGNIVAFDIQAKLAPESIANRALHLMDTENVRALFLLIIRELAKVWEFNRLNPDRAIGIDGQISNWSLVGFSPSDPKISPDSRLLYFDTSTPLMKAGGVEQLEPELFLRSAPSFLRWLIRWFFLTGVMTRYYDARLVTIDIIANLYKEQRPELVEPMVDTANGYFAGEGSQFGIAPLTVKEIESYYKEDSRIWIVFLALRRFDRWLHKHILHKPYIYILPGHIKR